MSTSKRRSVSVKKKPVAKTVGPSKKISVGPSLFGRHVLCRCASAGVHAGYMAHRAGGEVTLTNSRRLWYWKAKGGIALSGLAIHGLDAGSKVDSLLPEITLIGVIEIIPTTAESERSINEYGK